MATKKKYIPFIILLVGITILITIHELGHFLTCKIFNVRTPIFSIGFGPRIFGIKIGETLFQLAALPLGGYVSINEQDLALIPYYQKMSIILAGVVFNLIFAFLLLTWLFKSQRRRLVPVISSVMPNSAADNAGLVEGDKIVEIEREPINNEINNLLKIIAENPNKQALFTIYRGDKKLEIPVQIGSRMGGRIGSLGVIFLTKETEGFSAIESIKKAFCATGKMLKDTAITFSNVFRRNKKSPKISDPIELIGPALETNKFGMRAYMFLLSSMNVQLAFFNTLPIPLFDGGQALLYTIEQVYGQPLSPKIITIINFILLIILMTLIFFLSLRDIRKKGIKI